MDNETIPYADLSRIVDQILNDCDEDVICIRMRLSGLEPEVRESILTSDLLNAWQVFFYFFQEKPGDESLEILAFTPASALPQGVSIGEYGQCTLTFIVTNARPEIVVSDDIQELRRFSGTGAYKAATAFIDS